MTDNARVLLVDGDEQVRLLLSKALLARGVVCISSPSAGDAVALLAAQYYALMLLQIEMPAPRACSTSSVPSPLHAGP